MQLTHLVVPNIHCIHCLGNCAEFSLVFTSQSWIKSTHEKKHLENGSVNFWPIWIHFTVTCLNPHRQKTKKPPAWQRISNLEWMNGKPYQTQRNVGNYVSPDTYLPNDRYPITRLPRSIKICWWKYRIFQIYIDYPFLNISCWCKFQLYRPSCLRYNTERKTALRIHINVEIWEYIP